MYTRADWSRRAQIPSNAPHPEEPYRTPARRDSARLIHCPSFRRLQGKTQLFPGFESDYFRNRLTHSLEVGQIAKSIAVRLNSQKLRAKPLDLDLVELAGWSHDLGHPPFGHQGELALDEKMRDSGGFEGNAQTLRIVARLEKREYSDHLSGIDDTGTDRRSGLNLSARSLAAILKYDRSIPERGSERPSPDEVMKGFYTTEKEAVEWIKSKVGPGYTGPFKTVECQIMDVADDIAYSTYDLEDTFKAGFFGPLDMLSMLDELGPVVAGKVSTSTTGAVTAADVRDVLLDLFAELSAETDGMNSLVAATVTHQAATRLTRSGHLRSAFTSQLVRQALEGVRLDLDEEFPAFSRVYLDDSARMRVEVLKHFTYEATIQSPRVTMSQVRAKEIVGSIFDHVISDSRLLPDDVRQVSERIAMHLRPRVVCDFIAGMTDRYALEYYGRIKSENPQTIFKPL